MQLREAFELPDTTGWIEIFVLAVIFYAIIRLFKGTRGAAILTGMIILYSILYAVTSVSNLNILNWVISRLMLYLSLAFVVIFQPEIRRILATLGRQRMWRSGGMSAQLCLVDPLAQTVHTLSKRKIGALIAIERDIGTRTLQETGTRINGVVSAELLSTIFFPHTPLHDGGVIISGDRICAAGCLFPLSQDQELSKMLGTRHRAAVGLSEETDAIVLVVSEETGAISIAYNGRLRSGLSEERLRRVLTSMLRREHTGLSRYKDKIKKGEVPLPENLLPNISEEQDEI